MSPLDPKSASNADPSTYLIGYSADKPLATIDFLPSQMQMSDRELLALDPVHIDRLSSLLQVVPSALVAHEVGGHRYLRVVVDGPLAAAADGDGLRGFTRDAQGKFQSHGRFYEDDRLKNLVTSGALLQVASIVVAQKHLADISAKLSEIQEGVDKIVSFLEDSRRATITGRIDYLRQIAPEVMTSQSYPAISNELERCEVELSAVQNHLDIEINKMAGQVSNQKDSSLFGSDSLTESLLKRQTALAPVLEQWKLCMGARMIACQLLSKFEESAPVAARRLDTLKGKLEQFLSESGPVSKFERAMDIRIKGLSSFVDSKTTIHANRIRLSKWKKLELPAFTEASNSTLILMDRLMVEQQKPQSVVMELKVEHGRISEAYAIASKA